MVCIDQGGHKVHSGFVHLAIQGNYQFRSSYWHEDCRHKQPEGEGLHEGDRGISRLHRSEGLSELCRARDDGLLGIDSSKD